jgi:hypothetical protein
MDGEYAGLTSDCGRAGLDRAATGGAAGRPTAGRGAAGRGGAAGGDGGLAVTTGRAVVCGVSGAADGRDSSMRSRSVGGTNRPGIGTDGGEGEPVSAARGSASACSIWSSCIVAGASGASAADAASGATSGGAMTAGTGSTAATAIGSAECSASNGSAAVTGGAAVASSGDCSAASSNPTGACSAGGCRGRVIVLTRRGGPSVWACGLGGSGLRPGAGFLPPDGAGRSANRSPLGSAIPRWRARRSTN